MRFKKGGKVEVLSQKEVPSGAWQCAVIIAGNGHTYSVSYDWSRNVEGHAVVERVPRKAIRPCPPPVRSADSWAVGDVVEVFDVGFWKMAKVVKVFDENYCMARLLGSSEEFRIHKSRIRVRQLLKDDKWVVIGKGLRSDYHNQMSSPVQRMNIRIKLPVGNECLPSLENSSCQDSNIVSSTSLKRASPYHSPYTEAYPQKMRAIEKVCERQQFFCRSPSSLLKTVDAVAYPRENMGEKYMHTSFISKSLNFEKENGNLNGSNSCFERCSEVSDCKSDACSIESVGSCSVNGNSSSKMSGYNLAGNSEDADTLSSDADSFSSGADVQENCSLPLRHDVAAIIHRLELHAYRRTLMVMHASGSLSWEQEDLLTTLRMSLHISNDEHLMEGQGWRLACLASKGLKMVLRFSILAFTLALSISNFLRIWQNVLPESGRVIFSGSLMWFIVGLLVTVDTSCTKAEENSEKFYMKKNLSIWPTMVLLKGRRDCRPCSSEKMIVNSIHPSRHLNCINSRGNAQKFLNFFLNPQLSKQNDGMLCSLCGGLVLYIYMECIPIGLLAYELNKVVQRGYKQLVCAAVSSSTSKKFPPNTWEWDNWEWKTSKSQRPCKLSEVS